MTITIVLVCLAAAVCGSFVRWIGAKLALPDYTTFAAGLFIALLIFALFKG